MRHIRLFYGLAMFVIVVAGCLAQQKPQGYKTNHDGRCVPLSLPRKDYEPKDMDPDMLFDSEYHYTKELEEYWKSEMEQMEGIRTLPEYPASDPLDIFGNWKLRKPDKASDGDVTERWMADDYFDIFSRTQEGRTLRFYSYASHSSIYQGQGGELYIIPTWYCGTLKQLCLFEGKIYIYVLRGAEWVLDPVHEGGKNYYERESKTITSTYP